MEGRSRKKVLFIRSTLRSKKNYPNFQLRIEDGFVESLKRLFEVVVYDADFDLSEVMSLHQPQLILVEASGGVRRGRINVLNKEAAFGTPRLGVQIQDPHDTCRTTFLRDLDAYHISQFICYGDGAARQSPDLVGRALPVHLTIDERIFRDRNLRRIIPVTVFGGLLEPKFYPNRLDFIQSAMGRIPTLVYPHPGYQRPTPPERFPVEGDKYAEMLSMSSFSFADCTIEGYTVWKHLEIPASGSILLTSEFSELANYGFEDMQNCITGSGKEIVEKISEVMRDSQRYEKIRLAGYELVHSHYTFQASEGLGWLNNLSCQDETIDPQTLPFYARLQSKARNPENIRPKSSLFEVAMREAVANINGGGSLDDTITALHSLSKRLYHLQEPLLLIALIFFIKAEYQSAYNILISLNGVREERDGFFESDPEELFWAWAVARKVRNEKLTEHFSTSIRQMPSVARDRLLYISDRKINDYNEFLRSFPEYPTQLRVNYRPTIHWTPKVDKKILFKLFYPDAFYATTNLST